MQFQLTQLVEAAPGDPLQADLHAALCNPAGLMQQYQGLKRILAAELDVEPLASTQTLYQQLLARLET